MPGLKSLSILTWKADGTEREDQGKTERSPREQHRTSTALAGDKPGIGHQFWKKFMGDQAKPENRCRDPAQLPAIAET
jgi:hypothetical protein